MTKRSPFWASNLVQLGARFLQAAVIARFAGPHNFGIYIGAVAIPLILARVFEFNISQGLAYFTRLHPDTFGQALHILFRHVRLIFVPVAITIILMRFYPYGEDGIAGLVASLWFLITLSLVSQLFLGVIGPLMVASDNAPLYAFAVISPPALFATFVTVARLCFGQVSAAQLILCDAASAGLVMLGLMALLWKKPEVTSSHRIGPRDIYGYSAKSFPGVIAKVLSVRLDRMLLVSLLRAPDLALYSVGVSLRDIALTPSNIYAITYQNHLIDQVKRGKGFRRALLMKMLQWTALACLGAGVFWFAADALIPLVYGKAFAPAAPVSRILMLSAVFIISAGFGWMLMVATGHPAALSMANVLAAVVELLLLWLFATRYGVTGAAWSTVVATAVMAISTITVASLLKPKKPTPVAPPSTDEALVSK
jgi:O-antigen/teichoic acid export membrane protein